MANTISTEKDIKGLLYLTHCIQQDYFPGISEMTDPQFREIQSNIDERGKSISDKTIERSFKFKKSPTRLSYAKLNEIVQWYFLGEITTFYSFLEEKNEEIENANLITKEEINTILVQLKKSKATLENVNDDFIKESEELSSSDLSKEKNIFSHTPLIILAIVSIVTVAGFFFFSKNQKENTIPVYWKGDRYHELPNNALPIQQGIQIQNLNIETINIQTFRKVKPDQNTRFFNQTGQPQLWYASYEGQPEFFNASGRHPISNEILQPVSQEVIKTYLSSQEKKNGSSGTENKEVLSNPPKESAFSDKSESKPVENALAIYILNSEGKKDIVFTQRLNQLLNQYTTIHPSIPISDLKEAIQSENIAFLKEKLEHSVNYVCLGTVRYTFSKNQVVSSYRKCTLNIQYQIYSLDSGEITDSYFNTIINNGHTDESAKKNTLQKFKL